MLESSESSFCRIVEVSVSNVSNVLHIAGDSTPLPTYRSLLLDKTCKFLLLVTVSRLLLVVVAAVSVVLLSKNIKILSKHSFQVLY